ncbi:MAG TPA: class I SAM-dependent methyltransferase [Candidatus Eisenbacteria bacterium]|nr:class I SAM-dependent methyltransferase [Candidatus Eisenbacteria bacterium]
MNLLRTAVRRTRRAIKGVVHPALVPQAIRSLGARAASCADRSAEIDLAYAFDFAAIRINPVQVRSAIEAFLELLAARRPRTVLEVGTDNGGTLFLFARVATPDAHLISIDLPSGHPAGGYSGYREGLYRSFARPGQRVDLVRGDSHEPATADRVSAIFQRAKLDFLFIDGDHSYDGVASDYSLYAPMVRPGGTIAFHDIVPGPNSGGVPRFWQELKSTTATEEIVADWGQGGYGIGHLTRRET